MADPITERTAELEQGLDTLQSQVNARVDAPPQQPQPPAAPVNANAAPPPSITQVSVPPAPQAAEAPAEDHPTWNDVTATPEYKAATPEKQLVAFSRWHDSTYNMLQDHPDWGTVKDAFNKGAALRQNELSAAAGGITPDQARVKIADAAVGDSTKLSKADVRAKLQPLGPDIAHAYYLDKTPEVDYGVGHQTLNAMREFGTDAGQFIFKGLSGGANILDQMGKEANAAMGVTGVSGPSMAKDAADYWANRVKTAPKESAVDPGLTETIPATMARGAGSGTAMAAEGIVALPLVILHAGAAAEADAKAAGLSDKEAEQTAVRSALGMAVFGGMSKLAALGVAKLLPQGATVMTKYLSHFMGGATANETSSRINKAVEAAATAPAGEKVAKAVGAFTEATDPSTEAFNLVYASMHSASEAGKPTLGVKVSEPDKAQAKAQVSKDVAQAAADQAQAADSPEVAKVMQDQANQPLPEGTTQMKTGKVTIETKGGKKVEAPAAAKEVTLGFETDTSGDRTPKIEIPAGAEVADLQAAKKEVDASYPKDSAEANEFHRQLDEAIAEKEKAFAPKSAVEPDAKLELKFGPSHVTSVEKPAETKVIKGVTYTKGQDGIFTRGASSRKVTETTDNRPNEREQGAIKSLISSLKAGRDVGAVYEAFKQNTIASDHPLIRDLQFRKSSTMTPAEALAGVREKLKANDVTIKESPVPQEPRASATEVAPDEVAAREAQNEQHKARIAERNPQPKTPVAKEAVEAINNGNLKDLTYDGRGMVGEQFTEIDPRSPSHGATFEVPTNASLHDLLERRIELRDKFAGTEPRGSVTERKLETPEMSALNKQAYADAQDMKRKSGRGKDFDVTAAYNARRAELLKAARSKPAPEIPKAGEGATRAERSAANKAAHRAEQQAASAKRKEARAEAPGMAEAKAQITGDTIKRGVVPSLDEIQEAHPAMDITSAQDLRANLQKELERAYPPEAVPEGSKVTNIEHDYTKEELPMIETKDADGVTRTRPQFTNDPDITAQQKDQGLFSNDAGNRLYIPDALLDDEKVNPAISDHMKWDPEAKQYYVGDVDTSLGRVQLSHEEALGSQGVRAGEQQRSYTQLRQEQDAFGKAHAHIAVGDKLEAINEAVRQESEDRGIPDDAIQYDSAPEEGPKTEIGVIEETEQFLRKLSGRVDAKIVKEQTDEADDMGLIQHEGRTRISLNDTLDHVIADPKTPAFMREVAKLIQSSGFDLSHIRIKIVSNPNERYGGRYWHTSDTMEFNLAGGRHLGGIKTTFMHELVHGILDAKLEPDAKRNPAEQRAYDVLSKLHDNISNIIFERAKGRLPESAKELADFQDAQYGRYEHPDNLGRLYYGLSNLHEFVTEALTNPEFQNFLNNLEHSEPVRLEDATVGWQKGEALGKSKFEHILDKVKSAIMTLLGGKEITSTSPLRAALDNMFTLIKEGKAQQTVREIVVERARQENIKFQGAEEAKKEMQKLFDEANKGKEYKPDLNKIKDKQGLNRAERSKINKQAYAEAQAEAKRQGKGFDVMKEYEKRREEITADFKRIGLASAPETFTAEGRAKLAEVNARQADESKTGMTQEELNAEIAGDEEPPAEEPQLTGEARKPVLNLLNHVEGNGWVTPEGKFLPIDERFHQGLTAGVNPLVFGGHGSHGSAAWEYIQSKPELASAFDQAAKDKGYGSVLDMSEGDVKDFLEARGFLRVLHDNTNTYFTGKRGNTAGEKLLMNHAQDNGRTLIHDRETGDPRNSLKELYRPAHLQGGADALGFSEPRGTATEPAPEEDEQAKIKYAQRVGGKRNISIEGVPNKAQVEALSKQIDDDTGSSPATKSALKDQLTISARLQEPTLVERFQVKNPITGNVARLKDSGKEIVVAGANSANNIPRILAEQGSNRVAQDYGSVAKPGKEVMQDRSASTLIIDHGKDLQRLEIGRDQIANGAESGKKYLPLYDHAIENFDKLVGKEAHTQAMKDIADREHTYGIDTPLLEDYVTRILKSPDVSENDMFAVPDGKGGLRYFTKARSFETLSDAIAAGFTPKTLDIAELDAHRIEAGERLIQQKIYHESLRSVLAPDGKPIIDTMDTRTTLYHGEEKAVPKGYRLVNVPSGAPLVVHEDYVPLFKAIYGDSQRNALNKWAGFMKRNTLVLDTFHVGRIMFKEAAFSKGAARFGYGKGLSILEYSKPDLAKALALGDISKEQHDYALTHYENAQSLIRSGLNVAKISDNMDAELTKYLAPYLNGFNSWVFKKLSRGAMLQTALANLERNQSRFGELSRDEILRRTAKETNEIFGNLQLQSVFKNPQTQNMLRSLLLAPQWAESQLTQEFRGYGQLLRAPIDLLQGKARLGVVAQGQITAVLGTFVAMQVMSLAMNGHSTFQNKKGDWFALHIPQIGGRGEFEFNPLEIGSEYAFMAYRYRSQHMEPLDIAQRILFNKLNPVAHGAVNTLLNRDYSGKRFANSTDRAKAALESLIPLPPLAGAAVERDPRQLLGFRVTRQPAAWEKTLFQSAGFKLNASQTPRGEMFALAHRFRDDKSYGDNSPPVYRDLRSALDNRNTSAVKSEIELLAARGATEEQIKKAVGITHGGIAPEKFSGKADTEKLFLHALTADQRKVYNEAQADHKTNANLLRSTLSQMKVSDSALVKLLHKNAKKPKLSDFQ